MDALPIAEHTALAYASEVTATDAEGNIPDALVNDFMLRAFASACTKYSRCCSFRDLLRE
jgi:hypothetical protein